MRCNMTHTHTHSDTCHVTADTPCFLHGLPRLSGLPSAPIACRLAPFSLPQSSPHAVQTPKTVELQVENMSVNIGLFLGLLWGTDPRKVTYLPDRHRVTRVNILCWLQFELVAQSGRLVLQRSLEQVIHMLVCLIKDTRNALIFGADAQSSQKSQEILGWKQKEKSVRQWVCIQDLKWNVSQPDIPDIYTYARGEVIDSSTHGERSCWPPAFLGGSMLLQGVQLEMRVYQYWGTVGAGQ